MQCPNCGNEVLDLRDCDCLDFKVGDIVFDHLTREEHTVVKITTEYLVGTKSYINGIYIDSSYLDGGRFPWELTKLKSKLTKETL